MRANKKAMMSSIATAVVLLTAACGSSDTASDDVTTKSKSGKTTSVASTTELKMMTWEGAGERVFFEWLKKDGEYVKKGDPLYSVETTKSVVDFEADAAGYLTITVPSCEGSSSCPVGTVLGTITP